MHQVRENLAVRTVVHKREMKSKAGWRYLGASSFDVSPPTHENLL